MKKVLSFACGAVFTTSFSLIVSLVLKEALGAFIKQPDQLSKYCYYIVSPFTEEFAKLITAALLLKFIRPQNLRESLLIAGICAAGFSIAENMIYAAGSSVQAAVFVSRCLLNSPVQISTGILMILMFQRHKNWLVYTIIASIMVHFAYNFLAAEKNLSLICLIFAYIILILCFFICKWNLFWEDSLGSGHFRRNL